MSSENKKPYPYPQDIGGLLASWSRNTGYQTPSPEPYQSELFQALKTVLPTAELITEKAMLSTAREVIAKCKKDNLACISIDNVYMPQITDKGSNYLDVTRLVDKSLNPIGLGQRNLASGELRCQLKKLAECLGNKPAIIYDDVAWEGSTMSLVIDMARQAGINLKEVVVAIGIGEALQVIQDKGLPCKATYYYPEIIDTVSERDFMVGSPSSGRTIQTDSGAMGAPYIKPLGNPEKWASIPSEKVDSFSLWALTIASEFWSKAETLSQTSIPTWDLEKPPFLLPVSSSVCNALNQIMKY